MARKGPKIGAKQARKLTGQPIYSNNPIAPVDNIYSSAKKIIAEQTARIARLSNNNVITPTDITVLYKVIQLNLMIDGEPFTEYNGAEVSEQSFKSALKLLESIPAELPQETGSANETSARITEKVKTAKSK